MTKTKKRNVVAGIAALSLACCVAGGIAVGGGIHLTARADSWEQTGGETGNDYVTLPGNTTKAELTAKAAAKVAAINAQITAATEDGKSLADAYADGDIVVYSTASADGLLAADKNGRSKWKTWDGIPLVDLNNLNDGGDPNWGNPYLGCLSYDGLSKEVYIVAGKFAANIYNNGTNGKKLGPAVSDAFRVEGSSITYQNFSGGYMKLDGNNLSEVYGKNIDETTGTEKAANPKGFVGVANDTIAGTVNTTNAKLYEAFNAAYDKYTEGGFNVGYPFYVVKQEGDLLLQHFRYGDSIRDPYGQNDRKEWAYLAYNAEMEEAFLMKNEFVNGDGTDGIKTIGAPIGDEFTVNGNRYMNFEKGYAVADGTTPQNKNATIVSGKNVDEATGNEYTLDEEGKIGRLGKAVTDDVLPEGYTAAEFSAAFKAAYGEKVSYYADEELKSVELVAYANGYLSQTYTDSKDQKHVLAYINGSDSFVYLRPAVVSKMNGLGAPISDSILVTAADGAKKVYAYPFQNGYIRLTVDKQDTIEDGEIVSVINEQAVATSGATYDPDKVFFETTSFSDRITASIVHDDVINKAYWSLWGVEVPTKESVAAAFKKAYDDAFAIGFSAGELSSEGIMWWLSGDSGIIKVTAKGGNGNGSFWNDNTLISYNPFDRKAYITTGAIANGYTDGASGNGWATTEMLINTKTGVIVQQFKIIDTVTERSTYLIAEAGDNKAKKVEAVYDFDANKNGGEWVPYLSQFGGSISQKPLNVETVRTEGEKVEIDFASYVMNNDGYKVTWNKVSGKGTLSADGKYTLDAMTKENDEVVVEVYSAFDKLTFKITLTTSAGGENPGTPGENPGTPGENPGTPGENPGGNEETGGGCNSSISVSLALVGGMLAFGAAAGGIAFKKRKK